VFGPYASTNCTQPDDELRFANQSACFNSAPDPRHKDVYLELDWADCRHTGCPDGDDMHHSPNVWGLQMVIDAFDGAPVTNPDGSTGIRLHILVDESIDHQPNSDQDVSAMRLSNFGTLQQRQSATAAEILAAKAMAVRYVWSGHSSHSEGVTACPTPRSDFLLLTGLGMRPVEDYDWSPFGDANVGGRDILVTLGPLWSCPSQVEGPGPLHPCYRSYSGIIDPVRNKPNYQATAPGIFPNSVNDANGSLIDLPYPVARLLGLEETAGMAQLWGRTLMHLLGHSLGLPSDTQIGNLPDVPAVDTDGDGRNNVRLPVPFDTWDDLWLAPTGEGTPTSELVPHYDSLVGQDHDGDEIVEGDDNCPGVYNSVNESAYQSDIDFDRWGDPCDPDPDGDNIVGLDPFPLDTDNDGVQNRLDSDDDGDGTLDRLDNCVVSPNPAQLNTDGDLFGDACDGDIDGDGYWDALHTPLTFPVPAGIMTPAHTNNHSVGGPL